MFKKHPNLSDEVNANLQKSEEDGGVWLNDMAKGDSLFVITQNHTYLIKRVGSKQYTIEGHPTFCRDATPCHIHGSTWGGSMLKSGFIGKNMYLEAQIGDQLMTTSKIITLGLYGGGHD